MDPVSLCASILAIISAAQSVAKGLQKLKGYWKAPQLLQDITTEVESLQSTLHDVSSFIESAPSLPDAQSLCEPVSRAAFTIKRINALISSPTFYTIRLRDANYARVTWLCRKNEIKGLLDNLKVVRMDLMVRFGLLAASSIARIERSMMLSMEGQNVLLLPPSIVVSPDDRVNNGPERAIEEQVSEDYTEVSDTLPWTGSEESCTAIPAMELRSEKVLSRTTTLQSVQSCPAGCSCKCHIRYKFRSPWIFEFVCGRIDVQYSGQASECNELKCRRSVKAPFSIKYHFPQYLMNRYIAFKMYYSPLDGPTFALRAPRVIEPTSMLWHYIIRGDIVAVQGLFSEHKASPYDVDAFGCNGSLFAVNHHDCQISQFLIEQGADPTLPNQRGRTASELLWDRAFAGQFGHESLSIVKSILDDSDHMEGRNFSILHKIVLSMVDRDLQSELEISTALINEGDATQRTPLIWAVIRSDFESVELLLAYGADPNVVDDLGYSPLHFVQSAQICEALLTAGADISIRSYKYHKSPLHGACFSRPSVEVIDKLVEAGIPFDIPDIDNETPLIRALYASSIPEAERFLELGADVNAVKTSAGKNPLLVAVHRDLSSFIAPLLARGADYTALTIHNENIVHLAAELGSAETFRVLAASNLNCLDVGLRTQRGKTPADLLAERDFFGEDATPVYDAYDTFVRSIATIGPERPAVGAVHPEGLPLDQLSQAVCV